MKSLQNFAHLTCEVLNNVVFPVLITYNVENNRLEAFTFEQPKKTESLKVLEFLSKRKRLGDDDQYELYKQRKGYEGEIRFAAYVRDVLPPDAQVIYSILLQ